MLLWHEGQLRAFAGDYDAAIPLMVASKEPVERDLAGWNPYVDATVAFLQHDTANLASARKKLAAVPPPPDLPEVVDGFIDMPIGNGQTVKMRWPLNSEVVDGLASCFDKSYTEAYGSECRQGGK